MDMDQNKPVVLKFKKTAIDDLRDIYQECTERRSEMINAARENYFLSDDYFSLDDYYKANSTNTLLCTDQKCVIPLRYDINSVLTISQLKMRPRGLYVDEFLFSFDREFNNDDKKLSWFDMYDNEIPYNNSFSNIPDPPAAKRAQIRYDNERALWIKENQELIQTELNRVKSEVKINEL